MKSQKITTHLWYDKEAKEAAKFYTSIFPNSKIKSTTVIHDTPSGDCDIVTIDILGQEFTLISAGPLFKFNPSISFIITCKNKEEVDKIFNKLLNGGSTLMELGEYPFSKRFGWVADKYGLSWQITLPLEGSKEKLPPLLPAMMFIGKNCGKAEEAINFYLSVFKNSKKVTLMRYGKGQEPSKEGTVMFSDFMIEGKRFAVMDSAGEHKFNFNEAISFMVHCDTQKEIDYYWDKLSADPESEQCGWLKDKYGVSWQIVPKGMDKMMKTKDKDKLDRVTQAFLKMKKFDIAQLKKAYKGK